MARACTRLDAPPVGLHDALANRQAQAGPMDLGRVKRLKKSLPLLPGEPRTVVPHNDAEGRPALEFGRRAVDDDLDWISRWPQRVVHAVAHALFQVERAAHAVR